MEVTAAGAVLLLAIRMRQRVGRSTSATPTGEQSELALPPSHALARATERTVRVPDPRPPTPASHWRQPTRRSKAAAAAIFDPLFFKLNGHHGPDQPVLDLGVGDSALILGALPAELEAQGAPSVFERVRDEVLWQEMRHKGGAVPRLVCAQGEAETDLRGGTGDLLCPLYRHPADEAPGLRPWSPTILAIKRHVSHLLGLADGDARPGSARSGSPHRLNHALVQWYRSGRDNISEHADKTLDIARGSVVVNVSIGASRVMTLRAKRDAPAAARAVRQRVTLPHASLFVLGWHTNRAMTHAVRADKRRDAEKRPDELLCGSERISITFRSVATYIRPTDGHLFGQGARCKAVPRSSLSSTLAAPLQLLQPAMQQDDDVHDHGRDDDDNEEERRMLAAFSAENGQCSFNWEEHYGRGFDAIHMKLVNAPLAPT